MLPCGRQKALSRQRVMWTLGLRFHPRLLAYSKSGADVFHLPVLFAGALLSGWKSGKCVPCATCRCCSWPSCTVNRTVVPLKSLSLGQRTLYSSLKGSDLLDTSVWSQEEYGRLCLGCSLPGAPTVTSFAS